jgi:hypothetical protein
MSDDGGGDAWRNKMTSWPDDLNVKNAYLGVLLTHSRMEDGKNRADHEGQEMLEGIQRRGMVV